VRDHFDFPEPPSAWRELTPENLEEMLTENLAMLALDCLRNPDATLRALAARDWSKIEAHVRGHWQQWMARAEANMARQRGELQ
jgi:hypothetical protein